MRRPSLLVTAIAALLAVSVAAAVFVVVSSVRLSHENAISARGQAALAAGTQVVVDLTSLDYEQLDQQFARIASLGTPSFRSHYLEVDNGAAELIVKAKAKAKGSVVASGISTLTAHSATLAFAINETVSNTTHPSGTASYQRVTVQMSLIKGRWLINAENFVS